MSTQHMFSRNKKNIWIIPHICSYGVVTYLFTIKTYKVSFLLELFLHTSQIVSYGKCPKISNTKVSDKMTYANSVEPDQTADVCHSTKFKKLLHKKQNLGQNSME